MKEYHLHRKVFIILIFLPIIGLILFNLYLLQKIDILQKNCHKISIADDPVFKSVISNMKQEIKRTQDIRKAITMKMPKLRDKGVATWYAGKIQDSQGNWIGDNFECQMTSSGEEMTNKYNTCAHRDLPFGTIVHILNLDNGKTSICRINDRGPYGATVVGKNGKVERVIKLTENDPGNWDLILDTNKTVAEELGMLEAGSAQVILFY